MIVAAKRAAPPTFRGSDAARVHFSAAAIILAPAPDVTPDNLELREDGSAELREDGSYELRE